MLAESRRLAILDILKLVGEVSSEELANQLQVSVETIRRDLADLDQRKALVRVHGGAVMPPISAAKEPSFEDRTDMAAAEKSRIAKIAVSFAHAANTIFVDIGTTTAAIINHLDRDYEGTIITTSLRIATQLASFPKVNIVVAGGNLRVGDLSVSGVISASFLQSINPDVAFVSTGAFHPYKGVTDFDFDEANLKKIVIKNSSESFLVADSGKYEEIAPYKICDLAVFSGVITGRELGDDAVTKLQEVGAKVFRA